MGAGIPSNSYSPACSETGLREKCATQQEKMGIIFKGEPAWAEMKG